MFNDDIQLHGKHAHYVKELASAEFQLFQRNLDVFMNGAIVGLIYGKKEIRDRESQYKDVQTNILASAINKERINLDYIHRLIMILDKADISIDEKINRAFRDDSNSDMNNNHTKNLELFYSYALGGISVLYDKIIKEGINKEDYFKKAHGFMKSRSEELIEEGSADRLIDGL